MTGMGWKTVVFHLAGATVVLGQVQTFRNDYVGFLNAAGAVNTIDFETLPDGTPSDHHTGTAITSEFNYDLQGAHFSAPNVDPIIAGNTESGFDLWAWTGQLGPHTWITAQMTRQTYSAGVFFHGGTTLCAFDVNGIQLRCASFQSSGGPFFLGMVSSIPIARLTVDDGTFSERIGAFVYGPVPEPGTAFLLGLGTAVVLRRSGVFHVCRLSRTRNV